MTIGPLAPQLWGYWFLVDGVKALDPNNGETQRDGNRYDNLLMISGPESDLWDFKDVPHGTVEQVWYPSPTLKQARRRMYVYLPPDYKDTSTQVSRAVPAARRRRRRRRLDHDGPRHHHHGQPDRAGKAKPMIVVMPNGNATQTVSQGFGYGPTPAAPAGAGARRRPPIQAAGGLGAPRQALARLPEDAAPEPRAARTRVPTRKAW